MTASYFTGQMKRDTGIKENKPRLHRTVFFGRFVKKVYITHIRWSLIVFPLLFLTLATTSGCTLFPMRGQQVWRSAANHSYPDEAIGTPEFEAGLDRYTKSVSFPATSAKLLQNGDEAYPAMLALIASARERISLETYIVENDATTNAFFDALSNAAARGVEVRVLADAAGFRRSRIAQLNDLSRAGVQTRIFNSLFFSWTIIRGNNRNHRKILVVDGERAILGGINLSDEQLGDGISGWRDTSLLVSGRVALEAEKVFAETWEQGGRGWLGRTLPVPLLNPLKQTIDEPCIWLGEQMGRQPRFVPSLCAVKESGTATETDSDGLEQEYDTFGASVRVVASSPDRPASPTYDLSILGVSGARERIDIACAYFVPPLNLRRALLAAAARGVRIRLLLPGVTDVKWVREAGTRFFGEFLEAGIEIYEWPHVILHAKTMAVDGQWLVVGSANMDGRSYFMNYEACLAVSDGLLAERAHAQFELDLLEAKQLTLADWEERGAKHKALEVLLIPAAGQY